MAIPPSNISTDSATIVQNNDIVKLIRSLPLNQPLQAQIFKAGINDQLVLEFTRQLQINLPENTPRPELLSNQNEVRVLLTLLQKVPEIIFRLNIPEANIDENKNLSADNLSSKTISQKLSLKLTENLSQTVLRNTNLFLSLIKSTANTPQLKLLTLDQNVTPAVKLLIENNNIPARLISIESIENSALGSQPLDKASAIISSGFNPPSTSINTINVNTGLTGAENLWPQHATIETLSLTKIVSALTQLSVQIPLEKLPTEFQVIRHWIDRLVNSISQFSTSDINASRVPFSQNLSINQIRNIISHSGTRFENNLRQLSFPETDNAQNLLKLDSDIKAQIIKLLQAIPYLIDKYAVQQPLQPLITDSELWQVIFKVQKILETMQPTPSQQMAEQPQIWTNWIEQTFKLLTVWLKTIELHQFQQMNPQSNQQSFLRFDIPVPLQQGTQWVNIEMKHYKRQKNKSRKWLWQLTLNFNFGEGKYLSAVTKVNKKQLDIEFEGSNYFAVKMNEPTIKTLELRLKQKTDLDTHILFQLNEAGKRLDSSNSIHIEV